MHWDCSHARQLTLLICAGPSVKDWLRDLSARIRRLDGSTEEVVPPAPPAPEKRSGATARVVGQTSDFLNQPCQYQTASAAITNAAIVTAPSGDMAQTISTHAGGNMAPRPSSKAVHLLSAFTTPHQPQEPRSLDWTNNDELHSAVREFDIIDSNALRHPAIPLPELPHSAAVKQNAKSHAPVPSSNVTPTLRVFCKSSSAVFDSAAYHAAYAANQQNPKWQPGKSGKESHCRCIEFIDTSGTKQLLTAGGFEKAAGCTNKNAKLSIRVSHQSTSVTLRQYDQQLAARMSGLS